MDNSPIFVHLSCRENAHDNEELSRKNSEPHRESRITTC